MKTKWTKKRYTYRHTHRYMIFFLIDKIFFTLSMDDKAILKWPLVVKQKKKSNRKAENMNKYQCYSN